MKKVQNLKILKMEQLFINSIKNKIYLIFCLCWGFAYTQDKNIIYLDTIYIEDPIMVKSELIVSGKEYVNMFIVSKSYFQGLISNNNKISFKEMILDKNIYYFYTTYNRLFRDNNDKNFNYDLGNLDSNKLHNELYHIYRNKLYVPNDKSQKKSIDKYEYFDIYPRSFYLFLFKGELLINLDFSREMSNLFFPVVFPHSE